MIIDWRAGDVEPSRANAAYTTDKATYKPKVKE